MKLINGDWVLNPSDAGLPGYRLKCVGVDEDDLRLMEWVAKPEVTAAESRRLIEMECAAADNAGAVHMEDVDMIMWTAERAADRNGCFDRAAYAKSLRSQMAGRVHPRAMAILKIHLADHEARYS